MLKSKMISKKKNGFIWNSIGSICNASTSFLLLIFVTRILGEFDAGIFALGFANAQLILTIGRFGMRAYQATDINNKVTFSSYLITRLITSSLMLIVSILYILWFGYSIEKGFIIFSICVIKVADALEDVFHGQLQKNNHLDIAGKLLTIRNIITIFSFIFLLLISKSLLITCIWVGIISILACLFLNVPVIKKTSKFGFSTSKKELISLFSNCFPLFIGSFLSLLIYNIPKYTIDIYSTEAIQTYYSILFMPAFAINLVSEFIFKPLLTDLALFWNQNNITEFINYIKKLVLAIIVITLFVVIGGYIIGSEILSYVYGVDLVTFRIELVILLIGGGFSAAVYLLYNILTTIRKQFSILSGYLFVSIVVLILCPLLIKSLDIRGAAISYFISSLLLFSFFSFILIFAIIKKSRNIMKGVTK